MRPAEPTARIISAVHAVGDDSLAGSADQTQQAHQLVGEAGFVVVPDDELEQGAVHDLGGQGVHHAAVRVIAPDGTYAQTPPSPDSYETSVQGTMIEQADYRLGEDGNVADFVRQNHDKDLKLQFLGDQNFTTRLSPDDRKAAVEVYRLSRLLTLIADTRRQQEELQTKRKFIEEADRRQTGEKP